MAKPHRGGGKLWFGRERRLRSAPALSLGLLCLCLLSSRSTILRQAFSGTVFCFLSPNFGQLLPRSGAGGVLRFSLPEGAEGAAPDGVPGAADPQEPVRIGDLKIGQQLEGQVTKLARVGAFVNVNAERAGLVPKNKLCEGFCDSVEGVVKVGDKVTVWVSETSNGKFILSLVKSKASAPGAGKKDASVPDQVPEDRAAMSPDAGDAVLNLEAGQQLEGIVTKTMKMGAFVDVSVGRAGLVPRNKLRESFTANVEDVVKVGDKVTVWVVEATSDKFLLSLVQARAPRPESAKTSTGDVMVLKPLAGGDAWLDATVESMTDYGVFVTLRPPGCVEELKGLVYKTQIKAGFDGSPEGAFTVGEAVRVRVLSIKDSRLALSMKEKKDDQPLLSAQFKAELSPFEDIAGLPDEWLTGRVVSSTLYGVFVAVKPPGGGQEEARGLVPIKYIADAFIADVAQAAPLGKEVRVRVLSVDAEKGRLALSMLSEASVAGLPKPADPVNLSKFIPFAGTDEWLDGIVDGRSVFGAFVKVKSPDDESVAASGMVHITEMADGFVERVEDVVNVGQEVRVRVLSVDTAARRLTLSMKMPDTSAESQRESREKKEPNDVSPWLGLSQKEWLVGKVVRIANYGAFVEVDRPNGAVGPRCTGMVHISQVQENFVDDVAEVLEIGQTVQVRVVMLDVKAGRMALSMVNADVAKKDSPTAEAEDPSVGR